MKAGALRWDDRGLAVASDPPHRRRYRRHQSWYREVQLGADYGEYRGRPVGSLLSPEAVEENPAANFYDQATARYAEARAIEVRREKGTLNLDRLRRNMLSSMPLCFNIFGALRTDLPSLAELLRGAFGVPVHSIQDVICEWAPPPAEHLRDRTAFDAFVRFLDPNDNQCFLAIETKYTEPFSPRAWPATKYSGSRIARNWLSAEAPDRLSGSPTNQLWRNLLLAASLEATSAYERGWSVILTLEEDPHVGAAREKLEPLLKPGTDHVRWCTYETIVDRAAAIDPLAAWSEWFTQRYLPGTAGGPSE